MELILNGFLFYCPLFSQSSKVYAATLDQLFAKEHLNSGTQEGDHRIVSSTVDVRAYSSIHDAIAQIGSAKKTLLIPAPQTLLTGLTVPSNVTLRVLHSGELIINNFNLTINGGIEAGLYRIFSAGQGVITFGRGSHPQIQGEWFVGSTILASKVNLNGMDIVMANDSAISDYFSVNQPGSLGWCLSCVGVRKVIVPGASTDFACSSELTVQDKSGLNIAGVNSHDTQPGARFVWQGEAGKTMWTIAGCPHLCLENLEISGNNLAGIGVIFKGRNFEGGIRATGSTIRNLFVYGCTYTNVQIGDNLSQQFDVSTFTNLMVSGGTAAVEILGGNTQCITFMGGYAAGGPGGVGVRYLDGGCLFLNFCTVGNQVDYSIGSPQGGLHIIKGYSEASGLFLQTDQSTAGTANRPILIENSIVFSSDAQGRSIDHRNSQPLVMIGNLMSGKYTSAGATADGSTPPCVVDIGNRWFGTPEVADNQVHFQVDGDAIRCKGIRSPVYHNTAAQYDIVHERKSGTVYTNTGSTGVTTLILPAATEGMTFRFIRTASHALRIDPYQSETIRGGNPGEYLSLDSDGASVTLQAVSNGVWEIVGSFGLFGYETAKDLTGTVNLGAAYAGNLQDVGVRVELREGPGARTERTFLNSEGKFTIRNMYAGTYDVAVKTAYNLKKVLRDVPVSSGMTDLGSIHLASGDLNGDNAIDSDDLDIINAGWGTMGAP